MIRCIPGLLDSPGKRMTCGDDEHDEHEARQLPEGLLGPGQGQVETPGKQVRHGHAGLHPEHLGIERAEPHGAGQELDCSLGIAAFGAYSFIRAKYNRM